MSNNAIDKFKGMCGLIPCYIIYPVFPVFVGSENLTSLEYNLGMLSLFIIVLYMLLACLLLMKLNNAEEKTFGLYMTCEMILPLNIALWIFLISFSLIVDGDGGGVYYKGGSLIALIVILCLMDFLLSIRGVVRNEISNNSKKFDFNSNLYRVKVADVEVENKTNVKAIFFACGILGLVLSNSNIEALKYYFLFLPDKWDVFLAGAVGVAVFLSLVLSGLYQLILVKKEIYGNKCLTVIY